MEGELIIQKRGRPRKPKGNALNLRIVTISSLHSKPTGRSYSCEFCHVKFYSQDFLREHRETHFKDENRLGPGLRTYSRKRNLDSDSSNDALQEPSCVPNVPVECEFCETMFGSERELSEHRNVHFGALEQPASVVPPVVANSPPKPKKKLLSGFKTDKAALTGTEIKQTRLSESDKLSPGIKTYSRARKSVNIDTKTCVCGVCVRCLSVQKCQAASNAERDSDEDQQTESENAEERGVSNLFGEKDVSELKVVCISSEIDPKELIIDEMDPSDSEAECPSDVENPKASSYRSAGYHRKESNLKNQSCKEIQEQPSAICHSESGIECISGENNEDLNYKA